MDDSFSKTGAAADDGEVDMVIISLYDNIKNNSRDDISTHSQYDAESPLHTARLVPLRQYNNGIINSLYRRIIIFSMRRPRLYGALWSFMLTSFPLLIAIIFLVAYANHKSMQNQLIIVTTSIPYSDPWSKYYANSTTEAVATDNSQCSDIGLRVMRDFELRFSYALTLYHFQHLDFKSRWKCCRCCRVVW